jgi:hypothetical protein
MVGAGLGLREMDAVGIAVRNRSSVPSSFAGYRGATQYVTEPAAAGVGGESRLSWCVAVVSAVPAAGAAAAAAIPAYP